MIAVRNLPRKFVVDGITLSDPNPRMPIEKVKAFYMDGYPVLINCKGHETKTTGEAQVITFTTTFASKG